MSILLLDSNILACVVRPEVAENRPIAQAILLLLQDPRFRLRIPEIIDYELRRKLLHMGQHRHHARKWARDALILLDELVTVLYVPLTTAAMRQAAELWAKSRSEGRLRGPEETLDVDVILAAQALLVGGQIVTVEPYILSYRPEELVRPHAKGWFAVHRERGKSGGEVGNPFTP